MIRNQNTKWFRAVASLTGHIRWCLTGTPIQNKLEDLAALVRFIQVPGLSTAKDFRKYCIKPVERKGNRGFNNIRTLLQCVCIRRTKELLELPEFQKIEQYLELSSAERSAYNSVGECYKTAIDDAICGRKPADAYRSILQALLRLRLICNHGRIIEASPRPGRENEEEMLAFLQEGDVSCAYCSTQVGLDRPKEEMPSAKLDPCAHVVCNSCLEKYHEDLEKVKQGFEIACPNCSTPLEEGNPKPFQLANVDVGQVSPGGHFVSTKFVKIMEDIRMHSTADKWYVLLFALFLSSNQLFIDLVFCSRHGEKA